MPTCHDQYCQRVLSDRDIKIGLCPSCGRLLKVDADELSAAHNKKLQIEAGQGKIGEVEEFAPRSAYARA
jgi:threonine synthase